MTNFTAVVEEGATLLSTLNPSAPNDDMINRFNDINIINYYYKAVNIQHTTCSMIIHRKQLVYMQHDLFSSYKNKLVMMKFHSSCFI